MRKRKSESYNRYPLRMRRITINENKLTRFLLILWFIYLLYTIILSLFDIYNVKQIKWENAENISSTYSNYKGTLITYGYQKGKVEIARTYGGLSKGLNVWSWGIDKKATNVNISFYVKDKDYNKVISDSPTYHNLWFSERKKVDKIPFFGLRNFNKCPNKILLFFDLWKYNYINVLGILIIALPFLIIEFLSKKISWIKILKIKNDENKEENYIDKIIFVFYFILFMHILI